MRSVKQPKQTNKNTTLSPIEDDLRCEVGESKREIIRLNQRIEKQDRVIFELLKKERLQVIQMTYKAFQEREVGAMGHQE